MTKGELIRRLAKRSGVPESDTMVFFEMFLQKASSILKKGEAIKLKGIGFFQLRQGIIRHVLNKSDNVVYSDLMVYFPLRYSQAGQDESLLFNIPAQAEEEYHDVDSYFSLSTGRPVIPLEGSTDTEYFIPPSGQELRKLIESKVDRLLNESEIIDKYVKGNEVLLIESESGNDNQLEINWDSNNQKQKSLPGQGRGKNKEKEIPGELEHLAWDFGEDISKQIEEESIIDSANVSELNSDLADGEEYISWDFGLSSNNDKSNIKESKGEIERESFPSVVNPVTDSGEETKLIDSEYSEKLEDELNKYERVKSLTLESDSDLSEEPVNKNIEDAKIPEIFPHEQINEVPLKSITNKDNEVIDWGDKDKSEFEKSVEPNKKVNYQAGKIGGKSIGSKNKGTIILSVLSVIAAGILIFISIKNLNMTSTGNNSYSVSKRTFTRSSPTIIERKYDIPVTYPYKNKDVNASLDSVKGLNSAGPGNLAENIKNGALNNIDKSASSNENLTKESSGKIADNIFKDGKEYVVQISSWRSKPYAQKEASKFIDKGYSGFVEKVEIAGKGTWYRVKIKGFNSLIDAQNFLNLNK